MYLYRLQIIKGDIKKKVSEGSDSIELDLELLGFWTFAIF
jgi:hypothetical protein